MKDLDSIYFTARELPAAERPAYLAQACAHDPALRARVEQMLAVASEAEAFITDLPDTALDDQKPGCPPLPTIQLDINAVTDEVIGQKIGRYKILERIGEGGCGVVYVAEQTEPVRRRVALKVIKLGMDTKQVVARFEAERQALAMMDHPNIAKVLDAGATETGRPYFIMELVRGIRITDYCDQVQLATRDRLELFIQVCHAIQHAHQKGIIHRDIKPSNILVTLHDGVPVPKVIDFGIAKATEGRLTEATVYTQLHQFIGTPAYMSPEQAEMSGLDIDTRSDIYSLGVLLYELLAGSTPFDAQELMASGLDAMRKTIREKEPMRPSTKLATMHGEALLTTAKRRCCEVPKLIRLLSGDIDWIVMRCLEKDRTRRYETTNGLARDLQRHLNNEPVAARPPSSAYRFQKLVRRNKLAFTAATAVLTALCLGIIATTAQSVRATRATHQALAAQVQAVAAQTSETKLRQQAQAEELIARRRAYASDMNVAAQALADNNLGRAWDLLNRQRPQPGQKDLRGWEWRYLWQQSRSDARFALCQINGEVNSLAASFDGNWLAIGAYHKGGLAVWDLRERQKTTQLATNEESVRAVFSPTEPLLAFTGVGAASTLHLWNAARRQMVAELPLAGECVGLAFSPDGRTLLTSTANGHGGQVTLWRMPEGTKLASFPSKQNSMDIGTIFAATAKLSLAAYGLGDGQIGFMDLRNGREFRTAVSSEEEIIALAFSPDGKILASADGFGESDIRLWDVGTGHEIGRLEGHGAFVASLVFWPDGKKLASASGDQTIRVWDVADPKNPKCLDVLRGHRLEVWRLALLPDDKTLVSGCKDGTVCFWDTSVTHPRQARITIPAFVYGWCFAPDNQSILTLDKQGEVARWKGADFQEKETLLGSGTNGLNVLEYNNLFSKDGHFLAIGSTNGVIQVWDLSHRVLWRQWTNAIGRVRPLTFLADGHKLITRSYSDKITHEYDLLTGQELRSWPTTGTGLQNEGQYVEFNADGELWFKNLASGQTAGTNLNSLESVGADFSPDGKFFAVASHLGFARVWDRATWREAASLGGYLAGVHTLVFSPDGQRLATSSDKEEALRLWDAASWQATLTLAGLRAGFYNTAFSPDGTAIGSLNWSGNLHIWRAPSWAEIDAAEATEKAESQPP